MIALELANSIAPPIPCPMRIPISHSSPVSPVNGVTAKQDREQREDREAEVVGADAAEHVPQTAERGNEHRQHDQVAANHPQQVVRIARRQRIDVESRVVDERMAPPRAPSAQPRLAATCGCVLALALDSWGGLSSHRCERVGLSDSVITCQRVTLGETR
jgi:hypothetical protein